ncbi:hypothetical protein [Lederbergia citrisecunda]|nr:hypothetical protein [Lederbergia citrisecunda]
MVITIPLVITKEVGNPSLTAFINTHVRTDLRAFLIVYMYL